MPGVSSWLTGWSLFLAGWSLFLSGWLSKPHTSHLRYPTSDVAPLTSYIKLQTSHLTADLTLHTSVLRPPTSHLKDLRPATSGPTPQTLLLRPRTETSTSHLRPHISELGPQTSPYFSEYYFVLLYNIKDVLVSVSDISHLTHQTSQQTPPSALVGLPQL